MRKLVCSFCGKKFHHSKFKSEIELLHKLKYNLAIQSASSDIIFCEVCSKPKNFFKWRAKHQ